MVSEVRTGALRPVLAVPPPTMAVAPCRKRERQGEGERAREKERERESERTHSFLYQHVLHMILVQYLNYALNQCIFGPIYPVMCWCSVKTYHDDGGMKKSSL